jgi:hypothetical protein
MSDYGCFVYLYADENYNGDSKKLYGRQDKAALGDWKKRARSLTTGDQTWAELYADDNRVFLVGPNTTIRDLKDTQVDGKGFEYAASSIRIHDTRPDKWPGSSGDTPRLFTMSDLRRASANRVIKGLAGDILGLVPEVGDVISMVVDVVWPFGPDRNDLWVDLHGWARTQLQDLTSEIKKQEFEDSISGIASLIAMYKDAPNQGKFERLYDLVSSEQPKYLHGATNPDALGYVTLFGTIALAVYRTAYFDYDKIYVEPTKGDRDVKKDHLEKSIVALRESVSGGYAQARKNRLEKVWISDKKILSGTLFGGSYQAQDEHTHWHGYERDFADNRNTSFPEKLAKEDQSYFRKTCAGPTLDAEFDVFLEVADLWSYFGEQGQKDFVVPTQPKTVALGLWGNIASPNQVLVAYPDGSWPMTQPQYDRPSDFAVQVPPGSMLTGITMTGGKYVDSIAIEIDGKADPKLHWGSDGTTKLTLKLDKARTIQAVFGAWGTLVDHVSFRIAKTKPDGTPDYPEEVGLGTSKGGYSFTCSGSDGAGGVLTGFFGQVDTKGKLAGLGCYWTHDRVVAKVDEPA